ncbi:MAG: amidase domain-containing protein [Acetanaerobacterium sp.]
MPTLRITLIVLVLALLCACTPASYTASPVQSGSSSSASSQAAKLPPEETAVPVYIPSAFLTPKETVQAYLEQQYQAYASLARIDLSTIVDTSQPRNRNALVWLQTLILRRTLIKREGYCYVETGIYPYTVTFEDAAEDGRMAFWSGRGITDSDPQGGEVTLHFRITGEAGRAYPPMLALGAQHTIRLKQIDGVWKITFHYFPGSVRRFSQSGTFAAPDEDEMLADLAEEFAAFPQPAAKPDVPGGAVAYSGLRASAYAQNYTETPNPSFYDIGDWMGNCQNFISQCIWYGFSGGGPPSTEGYENMTDDWFAGGGGGSPAWENVGHFWDYAAEQRAPAGAGIHGAVLGGVTLLDTGDLIQVRTGRFHQSDDSFNHSLLVVDGDTLLLAQNSPDCFVYYSDLVNVDTRFFSPSYLVEG